MLAYLIRQNSYSVFSTWKPRNPPTAIRAPPKIACPQRWPLIQGRAGGGTFQGSIISPISWLASEKADYFAKASKNLQAQPLRQNETKLKKK